MAKNFGHDNPALRTYGLVAILLAISLIFVTVYAREGESGPLHGMQAGTSAAFTPLRAASGAVATVQYSMFTAVDDATADPSTLSELREQNEQLRQTLFQRDAFIRSTFGRYLTDEVLDEILSDTDGTRIGGERRMVSILFSDLRGSTALSEQMAPVDFIRMLNHFLSEMIEIINAWQGNILDFVGDAIVVVFGAPRVNITAARDAVACAVAMQRRMGAVNAWNREEGYPEIAMGIGLHTGEAILGNIGSETRTKYDMIGRNVNLASRVQDYTAGGQIFATDELLAAAGESVIVNESGAMYVTPKGIQGQIRLHDIVGYGKQRLEQTRA